MSPLLDVYGDDYAAPKRVQVFNDAANEWCVLADVFFRVVQMSRGQDVVV